MLKLHRNLTTVRQFIYLTSASPFRYRHGVYPLMGRITAAVALLATLFILAGTAQALPGPASAGTAIGDYNLLSGQIIVSVDNVSNWFIESLSGGMTGPDDALTVLPAGGGSASANMLRIGELDFGGSFSYTDLNLGLVALPGLTDVTIWYNGGGPGAQPLMQGRVQVIPEPTTCTLALAALCLAMSRRRAT